VVFEMAERLLDCAGAQLAATEAGAPGRALVAVGSEIAWDDCECGQLSVHVLRTYQSDAFPLQKQTGPFTRCHANFSVVEYVVTILRCIPVQGDHGEPPTPAAMTAAARVDFEDRAAVARGVACCFEADDPRAPTNRLFLDQIATPAEGMCAGSELHLLVGFNNCVPCSA
jgi:hypothetical protein